MRLAVAFLTVLPAWPRPTDDAAARAVAWYVPVGLGVGALLALATAGAWWALPPFPAAALVVTAWAAVTGALHLDGLADCADAALAPVPAARRIEIAHDVHHGTFAVVAVVALLLLKVSALAGLGRAEAVALVLIAPLPARLAAVAALRMLAPARPGGMGAAARAGATPAALVVGGMLTVAVAALAFGWTGLVVATGGLLAGLGAAAWVAARLGGVTGDVCGAAIEVAEAAALCLGAALVHHGATAFPLGGWR